MARPLRIEFEGAFYHVISRGERRENIFYSERDRFVFCEKLKESVDRHKIIIHAYALMPNHFHILLETPHANLTKALHHINTSYSNWFKAKHQIIGSVFQGRYKSILVEKDSYLKVLSAYIHLNPVRAKIVERPESYKWSSYRYYIETGTKPVWLHTTDILSEFSFNILSYKEFVMSFLGEGEKIEKEDVYGKNSFLGSKEYFEEVIQTINPLLKEKDERELPELKRIKEVAPEEIKKIIKEEFKISDDELFSRKRGEGNYRKLYVYGLKLYTGLSLKEIGQLVDLDYSSVSTLYNRFKKTIQEKKVIRSLVEKFENRMRKK